MVAVLRFFNRLLRWGFGAVAGLLIVTALYVSVGRQLIPLVAEYREQIEQQLKQRLQQDIQLGELRGSWSGLSPALEARDVTLGSGVAQLQLDELHIQLDVLSSLLTGELQVKALTLDGLQIAVQEIQPQQWVVQGIQRDENAQDKFQLSDGLARLQQVARLSVINSRVIVQPYQHESLVLNYVGFSLTRVEAGQRLDARALLPDGQAIELSVQGQLEAADWRQSRLAVYLKTPDSNLAQWLPQTYWPDWQLAQIRLGGELWLQAQQGRIQNAVLSMQDVALNVQTPLQADLQWQASEILGFYQNDGSQQVAWLERFAWQVDDQPARDWRLQARYFDQTTATWQLAVEQIELPDLHYLSERLVPMPEVAADVLHSLQPQGVLRHLNLQWQPELALDQRLSFTTNVEQVAFSSWRDVPAATGIDGLISGGLKQGELRLSSDHGFSLHLARIFPKPWQYQRAHAQLLWAFDEEGFTLSSPYLQVDGEEGEIAGDFLIRLLTDPDAEDYMDLRVGLRDGDARFTHKYLPSLVPAFSKDLEQWLNTAIRAGHINQGYFQYQGSLSKEAAPASRVLSLYFDVQNAELAYQPGWPALTDAVGEVAIEESGVQINIAQGQILNTPINAANATVRYSAGQAPLLTLQAELDSNVADGLYILQQTPLAQLSDTFSQWSGEGALPMSLDLAVPLQTKPVANIKLKLDAQSVALKMPKLNVELQQLNGAFVFDSQRGLSAPKLKGVFLGRPFQGKISAQGQDGLLRTHIDVQGRMPIAELKKWGGIKQELPVSGTLPYRLRLLLDGEDSQLRIDSSLLGVVLDLPAPFGKTAQQQSYFDWRMSLAGKERRYWLDYADQLSLNLAAAPDDLMSGRAELRVGGGLARLPTQQGLQVRGRLHELDITQWQTFLQRYAGSTVGHQRVLKKVQLQVRNLLGFGVSIKDIELLWQAEQAQAWRLSLDSQQVKGRVIAQSAEQPLQIAIEHLYLPDGVEAEGDGKAHDVLLDVDLGKIPALEVQVDRLYQGRELLGAWGFQVRPQAQGVGFEQLDLALKGLHVGGRLDWTVQNGQVRSQYQGRLSGADIGEVLRAWGFAPSMTSATFRVDATANWPGSPAGLALHKLNGSMDVSFRKGQLVSVDGGAQALRVFGLFNFDSIGRRLRLDFSDLLGKGLAYDRIKGELRVNDGVYRTNKALSMEGPSSDFELKGQLDLVKEQIDATLQVALPLTNNLPIAAVAVGAPAVGGALFIVDRLIGDRVGRFASVKYYISGDWLNPTISLSQDTK